MRHGTVDLLGVTRSISMTLALFEDPLNSRSNHRDGHKQR